MFEQTFKNIDDVLWKEAGCATELDYTEQTSWILFLKYLDDLERANEQKAELAGKKYKRIIDTKHRWSNRALGELADYREQRNKKPPGPAAGEDRVERALQLVVTLALGCWERLLNEASAAGE